MSLGTMYENSLPNFDANIPINAQEVFRLYGFHPTEHISSIHRCSNTAAFKHGTFSEAQTTVNATLPKFYAWSSYRFINNNLKKKEAHDKRVSFIIDFRTSYGTNVTMARTVHPFKLIPKA